MVNVVDSGNRDAAGLAGVPPRSPAASFYGDVVATIASLRSELSHKPLAAVVRER